MISKGPGGGSIVMVVMTVMVMIVMASAVIFILKVEFIVGDVDFDPRDQQFGAKELFLYSKSDFYIPYRCHVPEKVVHPKS